MINISRLILILCLSFSSVFGQTQNLILTREQNNKWLDSLKTLHLDQQLLTIKDRLLADTNVFVRQSYPDNIRVVDQIGIRVYGEAKPMIIIGGSPMIIDNKTEISKIFDLTKILSKEYIKSVNILNPNDPASTAIYGRSALDGTIVMVLTHKKYLKKFKQLKLRANY